MPYAPPAAEEIGAELFVAELLNFQRSNDGFVFGNDEIAKTPWDLLASGFWMD